MQTFLVTGSTGFIGSNFILKARKEPWANIINLDMLTYASNPQTLAELQDDSGYNFVRGDIGDSQEPRCKQTGYGSGFALESLDSNCKFDVSPQSGGEFNPYSIELQLEVKGE
jgi:nucleoside-diphosphate-sugar epimerase